MQQLASAAKGKTPWGGDRPAAALAHAPQVARDAVGGSAAGSSRSSRSGGARRRAESRRPRVVRGAHARPHDGSFLPARSRRRESSWPATTFCRPSRRTSRGWRAPRIPLASYFYSLDRVAEIAERRPGAARPRPSLRRPRRAHRRDQEHHVERLAKVKEISPRLRPSRDGHRVLATPVQTAQPGPDGRQRDVRPSRAPADCRRGRPPCGPDGMYRYVSG